MNVPSHDDDSVHDLPASWIKAIGSSASAAGYARIIGFAFPIVLAIVGYIITGAIESATHQMTDLGTSVGSINTYLSGATARAAERDRRIDRLETSDGKELVLLQDHEHRLTVLEQAALAEHERRLEILEGGKRKK